MQQEKHPSTRKRKLCALLRQVASCFIEQTAGATPAEIRESTRLRNETDSLVSLYETGHIDPVLALQNVSEFVEPHPPGHEAAPLTGGVS